MKNVVEDYIDFTDSKVNLDRTLIKKVGNNIVKKLNPPQNYYEKIAIIEVKDNKASLPKDLSEIVQMAFKEDPQIKVRRTEIVEWTQKLYDGSKCELTITKNCPECKEKGKKECDCDTPEVVYNVDRLWELSHPEFKYQHMKHYYRHGGLTNDNQWVSPYHPDFVLMKYSHHSFFNADSHVPGCLNLNTRLMGNQRVEYKVNNHTVDVNREKGEILISYLAVRLDDEGYRMIPDLEEVFEAIKWAAIETLSYREMNKASTQQERAHYRFMYRDAKQSRAIAMGEAYEVLNTPTYEDWRTFLQQNYLKVIKDLNMGDYYNASSPDTYGATMHRLTNHR